MPTRRNGFTLVEMLVVVAILVMLMAILMPAVQQALESARGVKCSSRQAQISKALMLYAKQRDYFPGYINQAGKGGDPAMNGLDLRPVTWVVAVFPFIDKNQLWKEWNANISQPTPQPQFIEMLVCPSDYPETMLTSQISYVVNCGRVDDANTTPSPNANINADIRRNLHRELRARGIFNNRFRDDARVSLDDILSGDGVTQTLMLSENIQAGNWTLTDAAGLPFSVGSQGENAWQVEKLVGFVWHDSPNSSSASNPRSANGEPFMPRLINRESYHNDVAQDTQDLEYGGGLVGNGPDFARPSSNHGASVNAAFCDGRVVVLRDNIDYIVYQDLMTPLHRNSRLPAHTLNDTDWQ